MFLRIANFAVQITLPDGAKMATFGDNLKMTFKLEFPMSIKQVTR